MKTIIREADEGEQRWFFGGGVHVWKVLAEQTDGSVSIFEDTMERGKTTPLHAHPTHDEIIFLLEGEILAHADGDPRTVRAGAVIVNPRGVPHAFVVTSDHARMLVLATPGTQSEAFYRTASVAGTAGAVDFGTIGKVAGETGATKILGPSPFAK